MQYRNIANTDLNISSICLGTMTYGDQNTQAEAFDQLDYAISQGINFIDTAEMYPVPPKAETYTRTETIIGNWIKKQPRDKIILGGKVAGPRRGMDWIRGGPPKLDRENIRNQLETLAALVKEGKVRYIGLSNEQPWGLMEFLRIAREYDLPRVATVQNCYNLLNRGMEFGMSEVLFRESVGLLAYSPLAFGHLSAKYIDDPAAKGRVTMFQGYAQRYKKPNVIPASRAYAELARSNGLTPTQLALSFVYHRWFVSSTIIGATTMNQLKENIAAWNTQLSPEVMLEIENLHLRMMNPAP